MTQLEEAMAEIKHLKEENAMLLSVIETLNKSVEVLSRLERMIPGKGNKCKTIKLNAVKNNVN